MENKLNCEIVRDLLPSYADDLTGSTTNKALEEHLANCEDCSRALKRMKEPEAPASAPAPEVDYLKKMRRRGRATSLIAGIVLMLLGISIITFKVFYIGTQTNADEISCSVSASGNTLYVGGTLTSSLAVSRITFSDSSGIVHMKIYAAPKFFFNSGKFDKTYTASSEIKQVRIDDMIVWDNGSAIDRTASQLFAAVNPYVGNAPSNERIAAILGIRDQLGSYKSELQTEAEPYGWTLKLEAPIEAEDENSAKDIMTADSYAMLATIGNLGYVTWSYSTAAGEREYTVTARDAGAYAGQDIKSIADSAAQLQTLIESLSIKWSGTRELLQEQGSFQLKIMNHSDDNVSELRINYYLNGKLAGSSSCLNANNSPIKSGDDASFEFTPENFPSGTSAIALSGFSFDLSVIDSKGNKTVVCRDMKVQAKYAWTFFFSLTGNKADGFVLNAG